MLRQYTVIPQETKNKDVMSLVKGNSKSSFMKMIPLLSDCKVKLSDKFFCTKYLLMTNDIEALISLEKFYLETLQENTLETKEKMLCIDEFSSSRNGMMKNATVEWIHGTTIELFWTLFQQPIPLAYKIQCSQYLLRCMPQEYIRANVFRGMMQIAAGPLTNDEKADLADLLIHCGVPEGEAKGREILETIRHEPTVGRPWKKQPTTVYSDGQNVHDTTINNAVKLALEKMADDPLDPDNPEDILKLSPIEVLGKVSEALEERKLLSGKIQNTLDRIATDQAYFTDKYRYRLRDILKRVWNRITKMPGEMREEAMKRLANELNDASGLCSTGHMSRIVNVLSGFSAEHGGLKVVTISWKDQVRANINARLNNRMGAIQDENRKGDVLNGMIASDEKERKIYLDFVEEMKENIREELEKEFENVFDKNLENMDKLSRENFVALFGSIYTEFLR